MNDNWKEILESYNKAWNLLKGPKGVTEWSRDEDNDLYHLWCAYHKAQLMKEKEPYSDWVFDFYCYRPFHDK